MKNYNFIVNAEKEMIFISDEKKVPQYNKKWGIDKRISHISIGFSYSREFLADNILSKNVSEFSKFNVRFVVFYNKTNIVTENTSSLKNLLKALQNEEFVILPVKANRRHLIPIREEAQEYAMRKLSNILRLAQKKVA